MTSVALHRPPVPVRPRDRRVLAAGAAILLTAFLVRLLLVSHGAGLAGSDGYDDGVYYAAADALVHGRLPYRDFLLLHPPGVVVAIAPFAALGSVLGDHVGVALARLAFIGVGTLNTALIMRLAARHSTRAAVVAGVVAAVGFPLAYAERSTLLEPLGDLAVLTATLLIRRPGRLPVVLAGAAAGIAVDVKIWYVVPLLVLVAFVPRRRAGFLGGAAAGAATVAAPFFAAAPVQMVREVVLDQLGRGRMDGAALRPRLVAVLGAAELPAWAGPVTQSALAVAVLVCLVLVASVAVAWRLGWPRVVVVQLAASVAVLLAGPSFFLHYAGFTAPWIAVLLGIGVAAAADRLRLPRARVAAIALACAAVVLVNAPADLAVHTAAQPVQRLRPLLAAHRGCVVSDDPGLLADSDVLSRDLAAGCRLWPDVTGWTYDRDDARDARGLPLARPANARWQHDLLGYLTSGDVLVLARPATGLSAAGRRAIDRLPVIARVDGLTVRSIPA